MTVVQKAGILSDDESYKLISPVVIEMFDEKVLDPRVAEDVAGKLWFTEFEVYDKDWIIKTKLGQEWARIVGEWDTFQVIGQKYGQEISYEVERLYTGTGASSLTRKRIERAAMAQTIPDDLLKDLQQSLNRVEDQAFSMRMKENEYYTQCLTLGFDISAAKWPWSAVYDAKALFSTAHVVQDTGEIYSNIVDDWAGNYAPLTFTSLLEWLDRLRVWMKDGLGTRIGRPSNWVYDLIVSPELEKTALDILSDSNGFAPYTFTGWAATNDNYGNVFMRAGFKVNLVVLETMNQPSIDDNTVDVGSDTMWFLMNKEHAKFRKALRRLKFGESAISFFEDNHTRAAFVTVEKFFGAQVLFPEMVVGSTWTGSAI